MSLPLAAFNGVADLYSNSNEEDAGLNEEMVIASEEENITLVKQNDERGKSKALSWAESLGKCRD